MIRFSHCKINLGLRVVSKRSDGYHDLQTVMYPIVGAADIVELQPAGESSFSQSGIVVDCEPSNNLCVKAFQLMQSRFGIPSSAVHLHKSIPMGAGLGGGSANGSALISLCNDEYELGLSNDEMELLAGELGSDTPFFIQERPVVAEGRGELLSGIDIDLSSYYIYIVKPPLGVSTAEAYAGVTPCDTSVDLRAILKNPVSEWRGLLINDFERSIFRKLPLLAELKEELYNSGATYASMSGSGSAVYGIFDRPLDKVLPYFWHCEGPKSTL